MRLRAWFLYALPCYILASLLLKNYSQHFCLSSIGNKWQFCNRSGVFILFCSTNPLVCTQLVPLHGHLVHYCILGVLFIEIFFFFLQRGNFEAGSKRIWLKFCLSQDAKKGVLFIDFPPVLQLQLKRFEYDFMRDAMVKVCFKN